MRSIDDYLFEAQTEHDAEAIVADENLLAQKNLFIAFRAARKSSGRSVDQAAELLGVSNEQYEQIESGTIDLTLAEVRQLAFAVDAVVSYRVVPDAAETFESHFFDVDRLVSSAWHEMPESESGLTAGQWA
jgi:transcriptional regulator with XRE-family HTH domain